MTLIFHHNAIIMVEEFIARFNITRSPDMWRRLVVEESKELLAANTAEEELKELCDCIYVSTGYDCVGGDDEGYAPKDFIFTEAAGAYASVMAEHYGEQLIFEAFKRVHLSNMSKLGEDGKPIRRDDGKILKGPNYAPPVLTDLLARTLN